MVTVATEKSIETAEKDATAWWVRNEQGGRFGPAGFGVIKAWAADGRIGPLNEISSDGVEWKLAACFPELEMDWVAEVTSGNFYGPIHRDAMRELRKEGAVTEKAALFRRCALDAVCAPAVPMDDGRLAAAEARIRGLEEQLAAQEAALAGARQALADETERGRQAAEALERQVREGRGREEAQAAALAGVRQELAEAARRLAEETARGQRAAEGFDEQVRGLRAQHQAQTDALEKRLGEAEQAVAEGARRLEDLQDGHRQRLAQWELDRQGFESACQGLRDDVARVSAEAAARAETVRRLEHVLAEREQLTGEQRGALEARVQGACAELESLRVSLDGERQLLRQAQAEGAALKAALEEAGRGRDEERQRVIALGHALAEAQAETARLQEMLREVKERAEAAREREPVRPVEVLEAEVSDRVVGQRQAPPKRPRPVVEVDVLPPEEPKPKAEKAPPVNPPPGWGQSGMSLAELELQARRELERLGAQGKGFFAKKR